MDILTAHIFSRLRGRGFNPDNATIEFVRVVNASDDRLQNTANEYWYLNSQQVPADLIIESPLGSMSKNDSQNYGTSNQYKHLEFGGGLISIETAGAVNLEFIRVIPEPIQTK